MQVRTLASRGLQAQALVLAGRPFEAVMVIEPMLRDTDLTSDERLDFVYWMARASEGLGKSAEALQWYRQAKETDPHYRDVSARIRFLEGNKGKC